MYAQPVEVNSLLFPNIKLVQVPTLWSYYAVLSGIFSLLEHSVLPGFFPLCSNCCKNRTDLCSNCNTVLGKENFLCDWAVKYIFLNVKKCTHNISIDRCNQSYPPADKPTSPAARLVNHRDLLHSERGMYNQSYPGMAGNDVIQFS